MSRCGAEASRHRGTETPVNITGQAAADPPSFHFGATGLDVFPPSPRLRRIGLPAILPPSSDFGATSDRAFKGEL